MSAVALNRVNMAVHLNHKQASTALVFSNLLGILKLICLRKICLATQEHRNQTSEIRNKCYSKRQMFLVTKFVMYILFKSLNFKFLPLNIRQFI